MHTRALALLVVAAAVAAQAQELDLSDFKPATVRAEVHVTEVVEAADVPDAGVAERLPVAPEMLAPATPPAATAPPPACSTTIGCGKGLVCSYRALVRGTWLGSCEAPRPFRLATDTSAERFKYMGTVPEGFHVVQERRYALVGLGIGAFAVGHLSIAAWALVVNRPVGLIPLAGPFLLAGSGILRGNSGGFLSGVGDLLIYLGAVAGTAVQVAGIAVLVLGLTLPPSRWLERDVGKPSVSFVPSAAGAPLGASLVGRF